MQLLVNLKILLHLAWLIKILFISSIDVCLFGIKVTSTSEPSKVGTLYAPPSNLPFNEGITFPIEVAAPVDVGIIFPPHARPLRDKMPFLWDISNVAWSLVYAWIVDINPFIIPMFFSIKSTTGAKQLVVQLAAETISSSPFKISWFTL